MRRMYMIAFYAGLVVTLMNWAVDTAGTGTRFMAGFTFFVGFLWFIAWLVHKKNMTSAPPE